MRLRASLVLAWVTLKEGIRERAFLGILVFALLLLIASGVMADLSIGNILKVTQDLGLSTLTLMGLLLAFFMGTHLMAKDLDKRSIYMILSKPISRGNYIFGKYGGLVALVGLSMVLLTFFMLVTTFYFYKTSRLYSPPHIAWGKLALASSFIFLEAILMLAVSIFFSSFASSPLLALFFTLAVYLVGESTRQVVDILKSPLGKHTSPILRALAKVAFYIFPDLSVLDLKTAAVHNLPLDYTNLLRSALYAFCYILVLLFAATLIFKGREMK